MLRVEYKAHRCVGHHGRGVFGEPSLVGFEGKEKNHLGGGVKQNIATRFGAIAKE